MRRTIAVVRFEPLLVLVAFATLATGCKRTSAPASTADAGPPPTPSTTARAAPSASAFARRTPAPLPESGPPPADADAAIVAAITRFFSGFTTDPEFAFLTDTCRPTLDRFLTMKNAPVAAAQKSARAYFKDKSSVSYVANLAELRSEARPGETVARLPVRMRWSYPLPEALHDDRTPPDTTVDRDVTVDVELAFDPSRRITRYVETRVRTPALRPTGEPGCVEEGQDAMMLGVVQDLGETYISAYVFRGQEVMRHVRTADGDTWARDSVGFAVAASTPDECEKIESELDRAQCVSATAAAWSECLRPVGEPKK